MKNLTNTITILKKIIVISFALIGAVFVTVFFGVRFGLFNVHGTIDERNAFFENFDQNKVFENKNATDVNAIVLCEANLIGAYSPSLADTIRVTWYTKQDVHLLADMINAALVQISKNNNIQNAITTCTAVPTAATVVSDSVFPWAKTPEWSVLEGAFTKDAPVIQKVSAETGVSSRLIVSVIIPEQFRFFTADRESYKKYFEPLQILGTMSQFSLGVSGIKPDTADEIEKNSTDPTSPFYPGDQYTHLLDYTNPTVAHDTALYARLTDPHDHYYQYLYTALFIKEIQTQWQGANIDLTYNPEIVSTIFNLGFAKSTPHIGAVAGGAPITIGGETVSFGELGYEFYFSGEMVPQFSY